MRARHAPWPLTLAALALAIGPPLTASTQQRPTIDELVAEAPLIVVATSTDVHSEWHDGRLFTSVQIEIVALVKGQATGTITVLLPGGRDAQREPPVAELGIDAPDLHEEESYLLFLVPSSKVPGGWAVLGSTEGSFRLPSPQAPPGIASSPTVPAAPEELLHTVHAWIAASRAAAQG